MDQETLEATMNLSVPDPKKDWIEAQTRTGRHSDESDDVRDLIGRDQERAETIADLQRQIAEDLDSGVSDRSMIQVLDMARRQAGTSREP